MIQRTNLVRSVVIIQQLKNKNIQDGNTSVSFQLNSEKRPLILAQDLLQIYETHTVVLRFTKRQDLNRKELKPILFIMRALQVCHIVMNS